MAFQTGTASGANDLLTKFKDFLVLNGWTQNDFSVDGSGFRCHVSKGTVFANMRSLVNETAFGVTGNHGIALNCSDSYSGAQAWDDQPGHPSSSGLSTGARATPEYTGGAIPAYWFFEYGTDNMAFLVYEYKTNEFNWLYFGESTVFGTMSPGGVVFGASLAGPSNSHAATSGQQLQPTFLTLSNSVGLANCYARINITNPATVNGWASNYFSASGLIRIPDGSIRASSGYVHDFPSLIYQLQDFYNKRTLLHPVVIYLSQFNVAQYYPAFFVKNLRTMMITFVPHKTIETIGGETWMYFPGHKAQPIGTQYETGDYGFAVRYVP